MKPGVPLGTMMQESSGLTSPSRPVRSPVTAVIVTRLVIGVPELVMNCFVPLITHSSPSSTAVVSVRAGIRAGTRLGEAEPGERAAGERGRAATPRAAPAVP